MAGETSEQVRPLAPAAAATTTSSDDEESAATSTKLRRRNRIIKCCSCIAALLLIQAIIIVILIFTIFRIRDPIIQMNGVTIQRLDLISGTVTPRPGSNLTLNAAVSVKNPNFASFRYPNTTTTLYYRGVVIGEARGPAGRARARRTARMNATVDVIVDRILGQPELGSDINSGLVRFSSFTRVGGRVRIVVVNRHVTVRMNCSLVVNVTSQAIQEQRCRRHVDL